MDGLKAKRVRLRYTKEDRFIAEFPQIQTGTFFLSAAEPLPTNLDVIVELYIAHIPGMFPLPGTIIGSGSPDAPGNTIELLPEADEILDKLIRYAARNPLYREKLELPEPTEVTTPRPVDRSGPRPAQPVPAAATTTGPRAVSEVASTPPPRPAASTPPPRAATPPGGVAVKKPVSKIDWLREVVGGEDRTVAPDVEPEPPTPPPTERKDLTVSERERVKPVGEFIIDLTKAMLRSGYYASDHPGSHSAKTGLYEALMRALGDRRELMIVNQETREKTDVLISGILDEPVTVRTVVGQGMAEMFVPRLNDFFDRKALVSFALKRTITPPHFETFIDIMSDPQVERPGKEGCQLLTNSLAAAGITEISTVFMDDLILMQVKVPWRVEMAINRLAKDLKVLPMYKGVSKEDLRTLKFHIIEDIVRPLGHPGLLCDIVINSYIIAKAVPDVDQIELEKTIVAVIPSRLVLTTARLIFDELVRFQRALKADESNQALARRQLEVKRILKHLASRMIDEGVAGTEKFLEELFFSKIMVFAELPPAVQYRVNTSRLTQDLKENFGEWDQSLRLARTADDGVVMLRSLKRVLPALFAEGDWDRVAGLIDLVTRTAPLAPWGRAVGDPLAFLFGDLAAPLAAALDKTKKEDQGRAAEAVARLGATGLDILFKALLESKDRGVRKMAVDGLVKSRERALPRIRQMLDEAGRPWFVHRNALLILSFIGQGVEDEERARKFTGNKEPRLREEALLAAVKLGGNGAESLVLTALNDPNQKVRRRAVTCLSMIQPPSKATIKTLLDLLAAPVPKAKEEGRAHEQKAATAARALGALAGLRDYESIEQALLAAGKDRLAKKSGLFSRIRSKMEDEDDPWVLIGVAEALGKIGGHTSLLFLNSIGNDQDELSKRAREAEEMIRSRGMK